MSSNGTSQTKNTPSSIVPPIPHIVPPPPPPSTTSGSSPLPTMTTQYGHRIIVAPPHTNQTKGSTPLPFTAQQTNASSMLRSPIRTTTTTLSSGNITLNTTANTSKIVPKTPPRQPLTGLSSIVFPFSQMNTANSANFNNRSLPTNNPHVISSTSLENNNTNITNTIQSLSPNIRELEEENNKKKRLNGGESISSPNSINLDEENSNTSVTSSDMNTPSTPQQGDVNFAPTGSARKRKRNEISNGNMAIKGCSCKKTGCLKRYCECFQNNRRCTESCNCQGCKNYEGSADLSQVLEKQGHGVAIKKTPTAAANTARTKVGSKSNTPQPSPSGSNIPLRLSTPPPPAVYHTNVANASLVGLGNLFEVIAGPDAIVELCKRLLLTSYRQEQIFTQRWEIDHRNSTTKQQQPKPSPPKSSTVTSEGEKTPPPKSVTSQKNSPKTPPNSVVTRQLVENSSQPSPDTLSLMCDEDDALQHQSSVPSAPGSSQQSGDGTDQDDQKTNTKTLLHHVTTSSHKGFENSLQVALEDAVLEEFSRFLRDKLDQYRSLEQQLQQFSFGSSPIPRK